MEIPPSVDPVLTPPTRSNVLPVVNKKFRLLVGLILGLLVLVCVAALTAAIYILPIDDKFVGVVTKIVPYPIAVVNMQPISFKDFYKERQALENFYLANETAAEEQMSEAELDTSIIETMIDREVIRQLANRYAISLDQTKLDEVYTEAYTSSGSEEAFLFEVERLFGWEKEEFMSHVVKPVVLASQVEEAINADEDLQAAARTKIDAALARLKNNEDFATVAIEVSEDVSAADGGDLGYLPLTQLPPEWLDFLSNNELNTPTEVIDLGNVYSIASASDQVEGDDGTQFNVKTIIVYKVGMSEVIENFTAASKIWNFLKI